MRIVFKTDYMQDIRPWKNGYRLSLYLLLFAVVVVAPWILQAGFSACGEACQADTV